MKTIRRVLIVLGAVSGLLVGVKELGSTPIYKGYDTGFEAIASDSPVPMLTLSNSTGDLNCWLELKLPASATAVSASMSNNAQLSVYHERVEGSDQWIAVVAEGPKREEKFNWPTGTRIFLTFKHGDNIALSDWRVYVSDKDLDSKKRATWRTVGFYVALVCVPLGLVAAGLEAYSRFEDKGTAFSHEECLDQLITSVEGKNSQETQWMQSILRKVSLRGVSVEDAIAPLPLKDLQKWAIWFKARDNFSRRLDWLISELTNDKASLI